MFTKSPKPPDLTQVHVRYECGFEGKAYWDAERGCWVSPDRPFDEPVEWKEINE